jgi:hypothetical protein
MNPVLSLLAGLAFGLATLLIAYLARRYTKPSPGKIAHDQLDYAQRAHLEHRAQAEYHDALADMYARQADRLRLGALWKPEPRPPTPAKPQP